MSSWSALAKKISGGPAAESRMVVRELAALGAMAAHRPGGRAALAIEAGAGVSLVASEQCTHYLG
jgi:hypothetical protein